MGMMVADMGAQPSNAGCGISVLLVNWNGCADLRMCLESLAAQTDRDFATIVVDNGSTDGSLAMLRTEFPHVQLLAAGQNLGFAEGCNRGLALCQTPWVFCLNNDTRLDPRAIAALRQAAQAAPPRLGMLQARIVFLDRPHLTNSTGVLVKSDGTFIDRDFAAPLRADDVQEPIFCASAGAALYRRRMLDELTLPSGTFDRSYFMYYEDVDLGWRGRLAGWEAAYVPAALVYHRFQASSRRQKRAFVASHAHPNKLRTLLKNASLGYLGRAFPSLVWRDVLPLFRHRGAAALPDLGRALFDGLSQRRQVGRLARTARRELEQSWLAPPDR